MCVCVRFDFRYSKKTFLPSFFLLKKVPLNSLFPDFLGFRLFWRCLLRFLHLFFSFSLRTGNCGEGTICIPMTDPWERHLYLPTPLKFKMEPQNWWFGSMFSLFQGDIFRLHEKTIQKSTIRSPHVYSI